MGPHIVQEALDPERTEPPVRGEAVSQTQNSQLETESHNTPDMKFGNLANLIEEAKKRAELRKKKGSSRRRKQALDLYNQVADFKERIEERGLNLDRSA